MLRYIRTGYFGDLPEIFSVIAYLQGPVFRVTPKVSQRRFVGAYDGECFKSLGGVESILDPHVFPHCLWRQVAGLVKVAVRQLRQGKLATTGTDYRV